MTETGPLASRSDKDYSPGVNQEPLQMESCEPPAALNALLWPAAAPKNRVGGSPVFSFVFAFQYIGETLDAPAENGCCGYDFASGVHKYLYAEDNPVNGSDPSGDATLSAQIGTAVHTYIGKDFVRKLAPYGISGSEIGTILHLPYTVVDLLPDLVDVQHEELYEIKPFGVKNLALGEAQLQIYIQTFNYFSKKMGKPANWHIGSGKYYSPPVSFELTSPVPTFVVVERPIFGVIQYDTLQDFVTGMAKDVGEADEAEEGEDTGLATMDAEMGAF